MEQPKDISCKTPRWFFLKAQLNNLSPKDFQKAWQESEDAVLIDVRTAEEFDIEHLPNALNISYFDESLWDQMEQMDRSKSYFIYCRTGRRSIRVCTLMRNGGFDNDRLFNLDGGMVAWHEQLSD
ncbi:MAG: rhodanese-like domain-containing protein [Bacteroidota bacterium]